MRAKFIRGQDPKEVMGLGIYGEIETAGYFGNDNFSSVPVKVSEASLVILLNNWESMIDDDYVFRVLRKDDFLETMDPDEMEGKSFTYKGLIYHIPES